MGKDRPAGSTTEIPVVPAKLALRVLAEGSPEIPAGHELAGQDDMLLGHVRPHELSDLRTSIPW